MFPQHFKNNGYHTEAMGKVFHIGHNTYDDAASWSLTHHPELLIEHVDPESIGGSLTREEALFQNRSLNCASSLPCGAAWESPDVEDEAYADGRLFRRHDGGCLVHDRAVYQSGSCEFQPMVRNYSAQSLLLAARAGAR